MESETVEECPACGSLEVNWSLGSEPHKFCASLAAQPEPSGDVVEKVARAIYDAEDTQSGDFVGTVIWNSDHLFYDTIEGESIVDRAWRASMPTCRDAARAAILAHDTALVEEVERLRSVLTDIASFNDVSASERLRATGSYSSFDEPGSVAIARAALQSHEQGDAAGEVA